MNMLCCALVPSTALFTLGLSRRQALGLAEPGPPPQEQEETQVASATLDRAWPLCLVAARHWRL